MDCLSRVPGARQRRLFCSLVVAVALTGCGSYGSDAIRNESDATLAQKITKGTTTKEQVRTALGDPTMVTFLDANHEQWIYQLSTYSPKITNFIPYVNYLSSGMDGTTKNAVIVFDKKGVVVNYTVTQGQMSSQHGILGR